MLEIITVGLDLAKSVFQVHGVDASGRAVVRKKLRRDQVLAFFSQMQPCVAAMEACGGAQFWGREIGKLGHEVRLIPPAYVKPFVKRQKNDAADAEPLLHFQDQLTLLQRKSALEDAFEQGEVEGLPVVFGRRAGSSAAGAADVVGLLEAVDFLGCDHDVRRSQPHAARRFGDRLPVLARQPAHLGVADFLRALATVPIFLLVPQVKLLKRLSLDGPAREAEARLPGLIVANWKVVQL